MAEFYLDLDHKVAPHEPETELGGLITGSSTIMIIVAILGIAVGSIILLGCIIGCCCSRMESDVTRRIHL